MPLRYYFGSPAASRSAAAVRDIPLVVIHPQTEQRLEMLAALLYEPSRATLYYRLLSGQSTLRPWLTAMVERSHTDALLPPLTALQDALAIEDPVGWAQALRVDLLRLDGAPNIRLVLDDYDQLTPSYTERQFWSSFVSGSEPLQVVLSARHLDLTQWVAAVALNKAAVVGDAPSDDQPEPLDDDLLTLEVFGFGPGRALINGRPIVQWEGQLPRSLFFFLIDRPLATRDLIFDTFWPGMPAREATNIFHVTKRKVNERISTASGAGRTFDLTQYRSGYYLPGDAIIRRYDVMRFTAAIEQAEAAVTPAEALVHYRQAIALYRGPFLEGLDAPWALHRREVCRTLVVQALHAAADAACDQGEYASARALLARAIAEQPERDDLRLTYESLLH